MTAGRRATCARCRRPRKRVRTVLPDGPVCAACHWRAIRHRGRCAGCAQTRLLPGADGNGGRLCCSCAGIATDYTCARCGTEWAQRRGSCEFCHLGDLLDAVMVGVVDLTALRARLVDVARPDSIITWLSQPMPAGCSTTSLPARSSSPTTGSTKPRRGPPPTTCGGCSWPSACSPNATSAPARFDRWVAANLAGLAPAAENLKILDHLFE